MVANTEECLLVFFRINDENNNENAVTSLRISNGGSAKCKYTYQKQVAKNEFEETDKALAITRSLIQAAVLSLLTPQ